MSGASPRRIWLCADDYGMSPGVNRAIRELIEKKRLNATSVMVVGAAIDRAEIDGLMQAVAANPNCAVGLHATLTAPFAPLTMHFKPLDGGQFMPLGRLLRASLLRRLDPEIVQAENENYRDEIKGTTAGLVIGDRAFEQRRQSTFIYDLGSEWRSITGLPFVFAVWVSKRKLNEDFIKIFDSANAMGLEKIDEIVAAEKYDKYELAKYYKLHLSYQFDEAKKKGLERFLQVI